MITKIIHKWLGIFELNLKIACTDNLIKHLIKQLVVLNQKIDDIMIFQEELVSRIDNLELKHKNIPSNYN